MLDSIRETLGNVPTFAWVVLAVLAVIGGVWFMKRRSPPALPPVAPPPATGRAPKPVFDEIAPYAEGSVGSDIGSDIGDSEDYEPTEAGSEFDFHPPVATDNKNDDDDDDDDEYEPMDQ